MDMSDPKEVWDKLDSLYLDNNVPNTVVVVGGRFFNFRLDLNLTFKDNFNNFLNLIHELTRCGEHIKPIHHVVVLLNSLPSQFSIMMAMMQYTGVQLTKEKVQEMVIQENKILNVFKIKTTSSTDTQLTPKNEVMYVGKKVRKV